MSKARQRAGLSAYEIARIDRIAANKRKLAELGLSDEVNDIVTASKASVARRADATKRAKERKKKKQRSHPEVVRRSSRKRAKVKSYAEDGVAVRDDLKNDSDYDESDEASDDEDDDGGEDVAWDEDEDIPFPVAYRKPKKSRKKSAPTTTASTTAIAIATGANISGNGLLSIEPAKTGRSRCRGCMEAIDKGVVRVGMKAWIAGRQAVTWQHPECFLKRLAVERGKKGSRGKCKATGAKLGEGVLKIGLRSHTATSWIVNSAARDVLGPVLDAAAGKVGEWAEVAEAMEGFGDLDDEGREAVRDAIPGELEMKKRKKATAAAAAASVKAEKGGKRGELEAKKEEEKKKKGSAASEQPPLGKKTGAKGKVAWKVSVKFHAMHA